MVFHLQCSTDRYMNLLVSGDMTPVYMALQSMINVTVSFIICQCLFQLLMGANQTQFNLRSYITGSSLFTCHILFVTSCRNWPSGPQQEVFKCVRPLHSRVLCLQIKRRHLLAVINWTHKYTLGGVRISESWVYRTAATLCTAIPGSLCNGELLPLHRKVFCNTQQSPTTLWLGQTSPHRLLTIYCSVTYHWISQFPNQKYNIESNEK